MTGHAHVGHRRERSFGSDAHLCVTLHAGVHRVVFDPEVPVSLSAQLLIRRLLDKNPATRISLAEVKVGAVLCRPRPPCRAPPVVVLLTRVWSCCSSHRQRHSWILTGLEDPERWLEETDPAKSDRIQVSEEDVSQAFQIFVRGRAKSRVKGRAKRIKGRAKGSE